MMKRIYRLIGDGYEIKAKNCVPRPNRNPFFEERKKLRTPWNIEVSIFKEYLREERKEMIENCFDFDWETMKQLKYKKSTVEEVKKVARYFYPYLKEAYREQAGLGIVSSIFSVPMNQFTTFIQECNMVDPDDFKMADADRMFITVNAGVRGPLNPA